MASLTHALWNDSKFHEVTKRDATEAHGKHALKKRCNNQCCNDNLRSTMRACEVQH